MTHQTSHARTLPEAALSPVAAGKAAFRQADDLAPANANTVAVRAFGDEPVPLPDYLSDTYSWAYLNPLSRAVFDKSFVVSAILWGNARRLVDAVLDEIEPGQRVLQTACVYGNFSCRLAEHIGPDGRFDVIDVAPIQVDFCRRKLNGHRNATVRLADAAQPEGGPYDTVCCFFLLHEVPEHYKTRIVDALLGSVAPGGKVVFVDYHKPHWAHPLKGVMTMVFTLLEPFAKAIWRREIASYATAPDGFTWSKETFFGGLYQKIVARRLPAEDTTAG